MIRPAAGGWTNLKLRVSFINFLNSVPLGWGFLHGEQREHFELAFDVPSQCAQRLAAGAADVGLIPAIEYQRIPRLRVLPDISISAKREVKSVLFVSHKPLDEIRTIALDTSSRTSVALLRVLLEIFHERVGLRYQSQPPVPEIMLGSCDAALIIGNPALHLKSSGLRVYDLAREWVKFTGLPFVFAFWAVADGVVLGANLNTFYQSKAAGLAAIREIADSYASSLGLQQDETREYLQRHLDYSLDGANLKGLNVFYELAHRLDLIPAIQPVRFYPVESRMEVDFEG